MSEYINEKRMTDEFLQLACIDSVSFGERQIADILKSKLEELGFIVHEDDAGAAYGSDTGNIYGFLKGTLPGKPLLFSSCKWLSLNLNHLSCFNLRLRFLLWNKHLKDSVFEFRLDILLFKFIAHKERS